jgi:glutamate racemase
MMSAQSEPKESLTHANSQAPVGVFDSGIGGLSVVQHLRQELPNEEFLYIADSAYAPYGERSNEELISRSIKITEFFLSKGIKALVIACNTATAAAVAELRHRYPQLIIIGMEPGIKPAAARSESKVVGVLATRSTLQSEKFQKLSAQLALETHTQFIPQACVGLVNEIEQGDLHSQSILELVRQYVKPLLEQRVDTLVLGCTHYPFVAPQIRQVINEQLPHAEKTIYLIDTGEAVARRLRSLLERDSLLNCEQTSSMRHLAAWTTGQTLILKRALGFINESDSLLNELTM